MTQISSFVTTNMENYNPQAVVKVVIHTSAPQHNIKLIYVSRRKEVSVTSVNLFPVPNLFRKFSLVTIIKEPVVRVAVSPFSALLQTSSNAAQNRTKLKQSQGALQDGLAGG